MYVYASDDGINAAQKVEDYTPTIEINGGDITVDMGAGDTDALDSNGYLYITGGVVNINAQSPFDYDMCKRFADHGIVWLHDGRPRRRHDGRPRRNGRRTRIRRLRKNYMTGTQ